MNVSHTIFSLEDKDQKAGTYKYRTSHDLLADVDVFLTNIGGRFVSMSSRHDEYNFVSMVIIWHW